MRPLTSTVLVLALCTIGSSLVSLISKPSEQSFDAVDSTEMSIEERPRLFVSIKSFFVCQNPLISAGAVSIIGSLFYLTHVYQINKGDVAALRPYTPYVFVLLVGARVSGRYLKIAPYIMIVAVNLVIGLALTKIHLFWSKKGILIMGILLIADWLWCEIQFTRIKLKAGKVWSFQYLIPFTVLVLYHLVCDPNTELVQIILPRVLWAIVILSCLASFALRLPRQTIKRNFQVNLVLFLTLMQLHRRLLFFAIVLSFMRVLTFIFKRAQFKNYLYPLILGFISYIGLLSIGFGDRKLPRDFEAAFVGMKDFHLGLCLFLYGSAMLSTIILGMLFMSFYDQDLELQEVELGTEKEESSSQVVAIKGHANIIKKRNIILYCFFYCLLMIGAAINPVILKNHKRIYLSMERFLVDGVFYLFTVSVIYFMG